jgi:predicted transposase/invertase (TIGR01784 family)
MKFLDVRTDYAFKKVFGSEQSGSILRSFLNAILYQSSSQHITEVTILDPYSVPKIKGMKDTFVDVKAKLNDGTHVIIEMQVLNHQGFEKRILYNAAKQYSQQLGQGENYTLLNPVVALTIADFVMFDEGKFAANTQKLPQSGTRIAPYVNRFKLMNTATLTEYSGDIELVFVELPKFQAAEDQLLTAQDKWVYFIKNAGSLNTVPNQFEHSHDLAQAFDIINEAGMSLEELEAQYKRREFIIVQRTSIEKAADEAFVNGKVEGLAEGLAEGLDKGKTEATLSIARSMKLKGLDANTIADLTGLSLNEIVAL